MLHEAINVAACLLKTNGAKDTVDSYGLSTVTVSRIIVRDHRMDNNVPNIEQLQTCNKH